MNTMQNSFTLNPNLTLFFFLNFTHLINSLKYQTWKMELFHHLISLERCFAFILTILENNKPFILF